MSRLLELPLEIQQQILRNLSPLDVERTQQVYQNSLLGRPYWETFTGLKKYVTLGSLTPGSLDFNILNNALEQIKYQFPLLHYCSLINFTVSYIPDEHRIDGDVSVMFMYGNTYIRIKVMGKMLSYSINNFRFIGEWFVYTEYYSQILYRGSFVNNKKDYVWDFTERLPASNLWIQWIAIFDNDVRKGRWEGRILELNESYSAFITSDDINYTSFYEDGYLKRQIHWLSDDNYVQRTYSRDGRVISVIGVGGEEMQSDISESESDISEEDLQNVDMD